MGAPLPGKCVREFSLFEPGVSNLTRNINVDYDPLGRFGWEAKLMIRDLRNLIDVKSGKKIKQRVACNMARNAPTPSEV